MGRLIILLVGFLLSLRISAQVLPMTIDETPLEFKVKQIDEFMHRFNFDTMYNGVKPSDSVSLDERLMNMYTVFRLNNFKTSGGEPNKLMRDFCNYVIDKNLKLQYEENNWMAEVVCNAKMQNKNVQVSLFLQTEKIRDVLYKWVLVDVSSVFMQGLDSASKDSLFISPAEHGISFITLPRIINLSVADVNTIFKKDWTLDRLSVFSYLISSKQLTLSDVDKVVYHWSLGNYLFDVERFEGEESPNQGWLISNLSEKPNK